MNYLSHRRLAYTLMEMLTVIAIVAVLSALLFPVYSRMREKGRAAQCQSNLHQLSLAFQQYSADNGTYPCWYNNHWPTNPLPSNYPGLPWGVRIQPYIKDAAVFQCPSDTVPATSDPMYPSGLQPSNVASFTDYGYNLNLSNIADSKVSEPSEVTMICDSGPGAAYSAQSSGGASMPHGNGDIHSGGANFAFVDGHIKWIEIYHADNLFTVR